MSPGRNRKNPEEPRRTRKNPEEPGKSPEKARKTHVRVAVEIFAALPDNFKDSGSASATRRPLNNVSMSDSG